MRFRREFDFDDRCFAVALVAVRVVEGAAEHPFLFAGVPIGPCVAADIVRAAVAAHHCVALAVVCFRHSAAIE